jgi:hypothetical protein
MTDVKSNINFFLNPLDKQIEAFRKEVEERGGNISKALVKKIISMESCISTLSETLEHFAKREMSEIQRTVSEAKQAAHTANDKLATNVATAATAIVAGGCHLMGFPDAAKAMEFGTKVTEIGGSAVDGTKNATLSHLDHSSQDGQEHLRDFSEGKSHSRQGRDLMAQKRSEIDKGDADNFRYAMQVSSGR